MTENRVVALRQKGAIDDPLTEILRTGARRLIAQAVEAEFEAFLGSTAELVLPDGRRRVVRHGHDPVRAIQTGIGPIEVQKPKARDRAASGERIRFTSNILPKWARRISSTFTGSRARRKGYDQGRDMLLLALRRRPPQHQHAFGLRLHARLQIGAVRSDVDVMARRQVALLPSPPQERMGGRISTHVAQLAEVAWRDRRTHRSVVAAETSVRASFGEAG
jgi:hypothetical protein